MYQNSHFFIKTLQTSRLWSLLSLRPLLASGLASSVFASPTLTIPITVASVTFSFTIAISIPITIPAVTLFSFTITVTILVFFVTWIECVNKVTLTPAFATAKSSRLPSFNRTSAFDIYNNSSAVDFLTVCSFVGSYYLVDIFLENFRKINLTILF